MNKDQEKQEENPFELELKHISEIDPKGTQ